VSLIDHGPQPGEIWVHYTGQEYQVCEVARCVRTGDLQVVYRELRGEGVWVRPLSEWLSKVRDSGHPEGVRRYNKKVVDQ
jgi:hypothetical protein